MSKIMLINVTHAEESRVGIVENGQLESFEIESFSREHLKGNIYKGTVRRIHPAIEAAFVDIGAERDAFLPLDEICFRNLPSGRNGASAEKGRRKIKEVLKSGDEVLVQIIKEQFTNKPPTLSTFYSLPGRYLVLLPGSEDAGISRKIEGEERVRVREMIERLRPPPGCGIIVRTAAGFDEEQGELERDLVYLQRLWENIRKHAETKRAPALIYREHDLVLRNIRDYFTPDINEIFIDNEDVFERAKDFLHNVMPGKEHLLHLYQGEQPIFSRFGLEAQIESIYKRRVQLRSGGSIVIDGTEALTAIDVNSGGSMRGGSQEETAHKTNLEAAAEVGRQLRLRDLGGIVVIDFIDMRQQSHINDVERTLREAMKPDKARHDIGRISRLGLLEVSRQRLRPAAAASSYTACPMCEGHGSVRTPESAALVALRKIHNRIAEGDVAQMRVGLPRDVAMYLLNQKRDDLAVFESRYAATITVVVNDKLMPHQSEIETRVREVSERLVPSVKPGEVAALEAGVPINGAAAHAAASHPSAGRAPAAAPVAASEPAARRPPSARPARQEGESPADAEARGRRRRRRGGRGRRVGEENASSTVGAPNDTPPPDLVDAADFIEEGSGDGSVEHTSEPTPSLVASPISVAAAPPVASPWESPLGEPAAGSSSDDVDSGSAREESVPVTATRAEVAMAVSDPPSFTVATNVTALEPDVAEPSAMLEDAPVPGSWSAVAAGVAPTADPWSASLPALRNLDDVGDAPVDEPVDGPKGANEHATGAVAPSEGGGGAPSRRRRRRGGKRGGRGRRGGGRTENGTAPVDVAGDAATGHPSDSSSGASLDGTVNAGPEPEGGAGSTDPEARHHRGGASRRRRGRDRHEPSSVAPEPPPET